MKHRPYEYYNQSQIFQLLKNNENDLKILMDVAYESAFRTWMPNKKRKEILSLLHNTTSKAIDSRDKEIKWLKDRLNERDQRIHELEVTEKYRQNDIANLKDVIRHEVKALTKKLNEKDQGAQEPNIPDKYLQDDIATFKDEILNEIKSLTEKLNERELSTHDPSIPEKELQVGIVNFKDEILNEIKSLTEKLDAKEQDVHGPVKKEEYLQKNIANFKNEIINEIGALNEKLDAKEQSVYDLKGSWKYLQNDFNNFKDEILEEFQKINDGNDTELNHSENHKGNTHEDDNNRSVEVDKEALKKTTLNDLNSEQEEDGHAGELLVEDVLTHEADEGEDFKVLGEQPKDDKENNKENLNENNGIKDKVGGIIPPQENDAIGKKSLDDIIDGLSTSESIEAHGGTGIHSKTTKTKDLQSPDGRKGIPNKGETTKPQFQGLFQKLIDNEKISIQGVRLMYTDNLTEFEFRNLLMSLVIKKPSDINPTDAVLYYLLSWHNHSDKIESSVNEVYEELIQNIKSTIGENPVITLDTKIKFSDSEFFQLALNGMQAIGLKWSVNPDIKYLASLPERVFDDPEVRSKFTSYLLIRLKKKPETFEGFMLRLLLKNLIPEGIRGDIPVKLLYNIAKIIANSDNWVESIPHKFQLENKSEPEDNYQGASQPHTSNDGREDISIVSDKSQNSATGAKTKEASDEIGNSLPGKGLPSFGIKSQKKRTGKRTYRPRNYWMLNTADNEVQITLELGLAESYTPESLSRILGFNLKEREYQFYLNEHLICVFRKMINGNYKTEWHFYQKMVWNGEGAIPTSYATNKENKFEVNDFIQTVPNLDEPSLWEKKSDTEWQLSKGNNILSRNGAILYPRDWRIIGQDSNTTIDITGEEMYWFPFEGEASIQSPSGQIWQFQCDVLSFNWLILGKSPDWMLKSNMTVVQNTPRIVVYTQDDEVNITDDAVIWIKSRYTSESWTEYSEDMDITEGIVDVKIKKDGIIAYDSFFNIGELHLDFRSTTSSSAVIEILNNTFKKFSISNNDEFNITQDYNRFHLELNDHNQTIPKSIQCWIGNKNQKSLQFYINSPVSGLCIVDSTENILPNEQHLSYTTLHGFRIHSRKDKTNIVTFKNSLRPDVVISKILKHESTPLISFKDEIYRLLYLADIMDYQNSVTIELSDDSEKNSIFYKIKGFTHTLNIDNGLNNIFKVDGPEHNLDLFAIPLDCDPVLMNPLPMPGNDEEFYIPICEYTDEFIVISKNQNGQQLMPRFVSLDMNYESREKNERIETYHQRLMQKFLTNIVWQEMLTCFSVCTEFDIPFSTFDQISAIARSSATAARAFLFLAINQDNLDIFIQKIIPDLEEDLGICFHWICKSDWSNAIDEVIKTFDKGSAQNIFIKYIIDLVRKYFEFSNLNNVWPYILNEANLDATPLQNEEIRNFRSQLGDRVLAELPDYKPSITNNYGISIEKHEIIALLIHAPIAAVESIAGVQYEKPIWGGDEVRNKIRRNIQYSQYLDPEFYSRVVLHVLNNIKTNEF